MGYTEGTDILHGGNTKQKIESTDTEDMNIIDNLLRLNVDILNDLLLLLFTTKSIKYSTY